MIVEKCIIVEGRSDKLNIEPIFAEDVQIICTNGTISEDALLDLLEPFEECRFYTLFDADKSGEKLRKLTKRIYSEAVHLFIPRTYIEVANAPKKVLAQLLNEASFSVHKQYLSS
ncbi:toprim domain-containing protein [Ureibacillus xyleni]|nr:toprim domain-containing protein [Ureibacillus xyleni]